MTKSEQLAARRKLLQAECAEQRLQMGHEVAQIKAPSEMSGATGVVARNKGWVLAGVGLGLGFLVTKPKWVVGAVTAGVSAYKLAQQVLPVLGWRKFEVH